MDVYYGPQELLFMCASALCTLFYGNPAPVIRSTQFYYCTASDPGTGADDAFVLKHATACVSHSNRSKGSGRMRTGVGGA